MEVQASGAGPSQPRLNWQTAAFIYTIIALGAVVCAHSTWVLLSQPISTEWLILLGVTAATGAAMLKSPAIPASYSISDAFLVLATLLVGPAGGAITAAVDGLVITLRMANDRKWNRALFNSAEVAIATWVAGTAFYALAGEEVLAPGPMGALRLMALMGVLGIVGFGLNSGMVAIAIGLQRRVPILPIWRDHLSSVWVSYFGGVFTAMLLFVLSRTSALEAFIFVAPLPVILYVSLRHVQGRAEDQISHLAKMNKVYIATIEALAQAVDAKDQVTHDHIRRVQENALRLARCLGVTDDGQMQALKAASLLHDIGKIAIPEHILNKPGRLNDAEFEIMKRHAAIGADILAVIGFPYPLVPIVRHHHENWDGTGYPDRLAGEQIPIGARILQVVDCYDALTSDRPYRPRMENAEALKIISDRSGTMYDPRVVDALLALVTSGVLDRTGDDAAPVLKTPELPKTPEAALEQVDERLALEAFFDLGRTLGGPTPAAGIGDAVWSMVRDHVPASAFLLLQYDPARDALVPAYAAGEPAIAPSTHVALGDRLSGWVAAARQTIVNSDARLDLDAAVRDASPLRSALAVPVVRDGQLLGVIAFYSRRENAFQERHTRLAEAAAYAAATRLHTVARQRNAIAV